jgi:hypothetical protein
MLILRIFNHVAEAPGVALAGIDSNADFFGLERFASVNRYLRARREPREHSQWIS